MAQEKNRFMLCINNGGSEDLEVRKVYEVLPDEAADKDNYLRVIDESGEDYLYPAEYFYPVEIAAKVRESLLRAA
jgi:hypothetical protein